MWKCRRCGKAVYFAERKTSMGQDWHPECLRCEECGKRLNPGQHAEHKGSPYCHVPCYSVLFGPTLFGHGSQVEAHTSFGKIEQRQGLPVQRAHLEAKLRIYNQHHEGKSTTLQSRERNGRLILEGSLRIYWGVRHMIHLKEEHDDRMPVRRRNSCRLINETSKKHMDPRDWSNETLELLDSSSNSEELMMSILESENNTKNMEEIGRNYKTLPAEGIKSLRLAAELLENHEEEGVTLRKHGKRSKSKLKRRCSINGHFYNRETSIFMPIHGSLTSVWTTSLVNAPEVIDMLLEKFKVENKPEDFSLYIVRDSGETRRIQDNECPLLVRVMLGPNEDVAKVFIMDRRRTEEISPEVAQFLRFSEVELRAFIQKFYEEEENEVDRIRRKYEDLRWGVRSRLKLLQATTKVQTEPEQEKNELICHM